MMYNINVQTYILSSNKTMCTQQKGFVVLTIVFLTRIATVDIVLWDDTRIVPCDSQQYSAHGVATGTTECY